MTQLMTMKFEYHVLDTATDVVQNFLALDCSRGMRIVREDDRPFVTLQFVEDENEANLASVLAAFGMTSTDELEDGRFAHTTA